MAIAFRNTGVSPGADSTSCVIVKPVNLAVGDLMIAHIVGTAATIGSFTAPDGSWNFIRQDNFVGTVDVGSALWWKVATQTDVDATDFTFTATGASSNCGAIAAFYGQAAATPVYANNGQQNAASTTITSPAITPSTANSVICLFASMNDNNTLSNYRISTSNPGTWNSSHNLSKNLANDLVLGMQYATRPETTSTGDGLVTSNGSDGNVGQMLAIAPLVANNYTYTGVPKIGNTTLADRKEVLIRQAIPTLGVKDFSDRYNVTSRVSTALLGVKNIPNRQVSASRTSLTMVGIKTIPHYVKGFVKTALTGLGITAISNRRWSLARTGILLAGVQTLSTRKATILRSGITQLGLADITTRELMVARASLVSLGNKIVASRTVAAIRTGLLKLGHIVFASYEYKTVGGYTKTALVALGLIVSAHRSVVATRSGLIAVGVRNIPIRNVSATRGGLVGVGNRIIATKHATVIRNALFALGLKIIASYQWASSSGNNYTYTALVRVGLILLAKRTSGFYRTGLIPIGLTAIGYKTVHVPAPKYYYAYIDKNRPRQYADKNT